MCINIFVNIQNLLNEGEVTFNLVKKKFVQVFIQMSKTNFAEPPEVFIFIVSFAIYRMLKLKYKLKIFCRVL